ncbi:hypothetical protein SODALDRAFT_358759 [Sodiomyces alkalinus F11]|uniref:Uncharacterized protein n=1 Tax=Sodiomyces alkalinus (strain CBS 110278 / VKM F-3762 / F11) TaxID=1314773 RepID=A0A3N2PWP9_SODAK|nr:hypothetical protein SODALDRAFT_358759 [Sodiomyces alkalinus F11]ROT38928.1 hypothetical protein SODALDRAFT_358759 [Sodiomyces alkalinus F11]
MDYHRSRLLEQVPLTVSPFVSLPSAPTLSYNYKPMPSSLPPSILTAPSSTTTTTTTTPAAATAAATAMAAPPTPNPPSDGVPAVSSTPPKPKYVVSSSGHAAHPDDIIASCRALKSHIARMQADAERELRDFEDRIRDRELAEKRRVAPGWLDSDARLLEPERRGGPSGPAEVAGEESAAASPRRPGQGPSEMGADRGVGQGVDQGAELDRAFGGLRV